MNYIVSEISIRNTSVLFGDLGLCYIVNTVRYNTTFNILVSRRKYWAINFS